MGANKSNNWDKQQLRDPKCNTSIRWSPESSWLVSDLYDDERYDGVRHGKLMGLNRVYRW